MSDQDRGGAKIIALVGGGALLLLLLLRGKGWGLGRSDTGHGQDDDDSTPPEPAPPCRLRVDADGIQLDGVRADLPAAVASCRASGTADITATGSAIVGAVTELVRALQAQGVAVRASASIWELISTVPARQP